jgi:asparagine synthase (glutamine-hydrolysing)
VEVPVPLPTRRDLADVVRRIEMPYKAQVEIGWPCLHLAREMQASGFKVSFSGEGSDELWASYGFSYHVLSRTFSGRKVFGGPAAEWNEEQERTWCEYRRGLFTAQHAKNFARCNKVFMAHGVECRLPFLHTELVEFALSVPVDVTVVRNAGRGPSKQKAVMYEAWDGLVPDEIVRRHKVAFQDGLGLKDAIACEFGWDDTGRRASGGDNGSARAFYNEIFKEVYA